MSGTERYRVIGGPGSPYSFKMRAVLRYRRIPHDWVVPPKFRDPEGELAKAGKGIIPVMQLPDGRYWADLTPMILALEQMHPGFAAFCPTIRRTGSWRCCWRTSPTSGWCSRCSIFAGRNRSTRSFARGGRWPAGSARCRGRSSTRWSTSSATGRSACWRAPATSQPTVRSGRKAIAACCEAIELQVQHSRFFFGGRPSIGDFGHYGQLSQLAVDPTPSAIMRRDAVRTYQWQHDLDDASGIEGRVARSACAARSRRGRAARTRRRHLPAVPGRERGRDRRRHQDLRPASSTARAIQTRHAPTSGAACCG